MAAWKCMIYDWKMELYWRLPVFLQEAVLTNYARRLDKFYYGQPFEEWRRRFKSWQNWSRADVETWQNQQLQSLVELAATKIPYYRDAWRDVDWKSVRSAADLLSLPRLERQAIRQNEKAFIVEGLNPRSLWIE